MGWKVVYKVTFPNGKIYVGQDVTDDPRYMGSADRELIRGDFTREQLRDFTVRKQILWESETASAAELRAVENRYIVQLGANDPEIGYNRSPAFGKRQHRQIADEIAASGG
jgi:hypothetical protein